MANLTLDDSTFEQLLTVLSHHVMAELEEIAPFDKKNDQEKEEIIRVCLKTLETSAVVMSSFIHPSGFDQKKLEKIFQLIKENKFQEVQKHLNK